MLAMKYTKALRLRGFTLIELMVTLALAAVLMMVAVPSFVTFQRNSELTSVANNLVGAMNTARTEAMKRNMNVYVAPISGTDWDTGWQVFIDVDRDGAFSTGDIIVTTYPALPNYIDATSTSTPAAFNGSGYSFIGNNLSNLTINIARNDTTAAELLDQTRRVKVATTGRVRSCKGTDTTNCTAGAGG
jgi:type IV fimbrial biogenesis protein FimT